MSIVGPLSNFASAKFPAEDFGRAVPPVLRALLSAQAHSEGVELGYWLEPYLKAIITNALPNPLRRLASLGGAIPTRWRLPDAPTFRGEFIARQMEKEIEAAVSVPPAALDVAGVPPQHRHVLCTPGSEDASILKSESEKRIWFDQLAATGYERKISTVTPAMVCAVEALLVSAPNMREATTFVLGQLALAQRSHGALLSLPPILLVGAPSAGKTWWASELAKALCVHNEFIGMPTVSGAFELAGGSSSWHIAKPGRIVRTFLQTLDASPVFILDEIDKMNVGNYAPEPVLLGLVERATAKRFRDEFFNRDFDVSRSIFIATANDPKRMDSALRTRFREIFVRAPTKAEREPVIASIWRSLRAEHPDLELPEVLHGSVMATLIDRFEHARATQRLLEDGLGQAARRRGPLRLLARDVGGRPARVAHSAGSVVLTGDFGLQ